MFRYDIQAFNEAVIREALLNAVSHGGYCQGGSIFVRSSPRKRCNIVDWLSARGKARIESFVIVSRRARVGPTTRAPIIPRPPLSWMARSAIPVLFNIWIALQMSAT